MDPRKRTRLFDLHYPAGKSGSQKKLPIQSESGNAQSNRPPLLDDTEYLKMTLLRLEESKVDQDESAYGEGQYIKYSYLLNMPVPCLSALCWVLNDMLNQSLFPNNLIVNQSLQLIASVGLLDQVFSLHEIAVERKIADHVTYATTINAIAKSEQPDVREVKLLLEEAKQAGFADKIADHCILDAMFLLKEVETLELLTSKPSALAANSSFAAKSADPFILPPKKDFHNRSGL